MQHREAAHYILNQVRACVDNVGDAEVETFISMMQKAKSVVVFGRGLPEYEAVPTHDGVDLALTLLLSGASSSLTDENHRIVHPTDSFLSTGKEGKCADCHEAGTEGARAAAASSTGRC